MASWNIRDKNGFWKGGRVEASNGYILIKVGFDHHLSDVRGYAYEHRLVAESKIGRRLDPGEQVHHINGDKHNNSPENIEVMKSQRQHRFAHRNPGSNRRLPSEENPTILCGCGCGTEITAFDNSGRPRKYVSGHNTLTRTTRGTYGRKN